MTQTDKLLLEVLEAQIAWWEQLPCGIDENAEAGNPSPENAIAHIAGLAVKEARAAIAKARAGPIDEMAQRWAKTERFYQERRE